MLINCVVYENGVRLAEIHVNEIGSYLSRPRCFVWVALRDATDEELRALQEQFGLHHLAVEDAHHGHQRPKVEEYDESLFVVMHLLEVDEAEEGQLGMGELAVFVGGNYVVTVRKGSERGFADVRERCEREPGLLRNGPGFVLYALMDAVVDRYFPVIDALEAELETIEQQIFVSSATRKSIKRLYGLKQRLTVVRHAVTALLEGTSKLHGGRVPQSCMDLQDYFRDVIDHLSRINASIDAIRDTIGTAMQVTLSMVTIDQGEVTKRLAAWAAIFAVCTAFAGIWGMNFEFMPELKWRYGYPIALSLIVATCGYLYFRFRRARWL